MLRESFMTGWRFAADGNALQDILLPHDAMQRQGRDANAPSGRSEAYFRGGSYRYEKTFQPEENWKYVEFEGVYPTAEVFLNGQRIGGYAYGYTRFRVPLTGLRPGEENTLTVEVENQIQPTSRWYPGAGIYRPVWILTGGEAHIVPDSVRVTTLSCDPARIRVQAVHSGCPTDEIVTEIRYQNEMVAAGVGCDLTLEIPDAKLWSAEAPRLYECRVILTRNGEILDTHHTKFGIRKVEWSYDGLTVNGQTVKLQGGCVHHDNGILGARSYRESEWRRIRCMKEFGFNAIRSAHNPISVAALEACDELGMYVMDESWDMWDKAKSVGDYAARFTEHYGEDLRSLVAKDYNHPCVIMYSMGNEVTEPAKPEGVALGKEILAKFKVLDDTRPITAGINPVLIALAQLQEENPIIESNKEAPKMDSTAYNKMVSEQGKRMLQGSATPMVDQAASPIYDILDIAGYNYASPRYELDRQLHPGRIIVGSETFPCDLPENWELVEKFPNVLGDFMWTAWDYLGEVGLGGWSYTQEDADFNKTYPWLLADSGAFDILGNDNAEAGMAAVVWRHRKTPYIGVTPANRPGREVIRAIWRGSNAIPSWSWKNCGGNAATVEVYSRAAQVELLLNGLSLGRRATERCKAEFAVTYQPGELKAIAYNADGVYESESVLRSADENTRIRITREEDPCGDAGIVYLDIALVGENGEVESNADTLLHITVEGGRLLAFGSADPKTEENYLSGSYTTYYGRAQAVILPESQPVRVTVAGDGLAPASLTL